jgi:Mg2+-importing ATPase
VAAPQQAIKVAQVMLDVSRLSAADALSSVKSRAEGLTADEAATRLAEVGPNRAAKDAGSSPWRRVAHAVANPLVVLLAVLAGLSFATGDLRAGTMMTVMIVLGVGLKLVQESRADGAVARLNAMISVTATVIRDGAPVEVPLADLVPGDVVKLAAGDMIPADVRVLSAKDLFIAQSALTGESFPIEKFELEKDASRPPLELANLAWLGTSVESGSAHALVVTTGTRTYLGGMARAIGATQPPTAFDRGVSNFTWMMIRFMAVMVPLVFVINGFSHHDWTGAFFFALAVAVGLTPEMLPMIVTVCLSKGSMEMAKKKVIVKRINAIQNLGAMDVLCTDKTGTLTMDKVLLEKHCDVVLNDDDRVLELAFLNAHFQTGLRNVLDRAILAHREIHEQAHTPELSKVDEIPFDFQRRLMSVVVQLPDGKQQLITKGAPEAVFPRCTSFSLEGEELPVEPLMIQDLKEEYERLSRDGFRVLAVASKLVDARVTPWSKDDEKDLVLNGYVAFLDPPKDSAREAIAALQSHGVSVKVVTGDNELVSAKICREVGLGADHVLMGTDVEGMTDEQLKARAEEVTLFARVSPAHKQRIIRALQANGHTVGFMGDGINDAPALRAADVGISVEEAVDIARESADMVLLEKSLMVLEEGVLEGRKVFVNILKYVRMGASSNFGNMFSVLGASLFVPFLPMLPIQILTNNLLYDLSQTAIPTDEVDPEQILKPRQWDMGTLWRFIVFIGPCSSVFDYTTFFLMLWVFGCSNVATPADAHASASMFQSGWFVESIATQSLIIHVIRTNRLPFVQSRASWPLMVATACVIALGAWLPGSPIGAWFGFSALPLGYWPALVATLLAYMVLTQGVKTLLRRKAWL